MSGFYLDGSEVEALAADLAGAPGRVRVNARQTTIRGAGIVNRNMRRIVAGHAGNLWGRPGTSYNIPLQRHVTNSMIGPLFAEIGIRPGGSGSLAHILAYGSINNSPVFDHTVALTQAEPALERMYASAAEESVFGGARAGRG